MPQFVKLLSQTGESIASDASVFLRIKKNS